MASGPLPLHGAVPVVTRVEELAGIGLARRQAVTAALAQGFDEAGQARLALIATEMATNLLKHARGGEIRTILCDQPSTGGVTLLATDRGPGIADLPASMVDGVSSTGTLGGGLGSIARASDFADACSVLGRGTVLMSQNWAAPPPPLPRRMFRAGAIGDSHPAEQVSGDAWAVEQAGDVVRVLVVDGLGHGPEAAAAASAAVGSFRAAAEPVESTVLRMHAELRGTRGAAVAVVEVDRSAGRLRFCGIGNIAGRVYGPEGSTPLLSRFGIVGHQVQKVQSFDLRWERDSVLVLHSDGLSSKWELDLPSLWRHHPLVVAGTVMRDAPHRHDDKTVLALDEALAAGPGLRED